MDVVGVRDDEIAVGPAAPQRDGEQQVIVGDLAVAVAIESREVFDELDPSLAEHAQIEVRVHALDLAAEFPVVRAAHERQRVGDLPSILPGSLRYSKRRPGGQAGERELDARFYRDDIVVEAAVADAQRVDGAGREHASPGAEHAVHPVARCLAL
jgi:hypothetical protein